MPTMEASPMGVRRRAAILGSLAACVFAAGPRGTARAQTAGAAADIFALKVDYSATSVVGDGGARGRLWRSGRALRHEGGAGGQGHVLIVRLDRNIGWLALADMGMAIESDLSALDLPLQVLDGNGGGGMIQIREGRERVNGLDTTRVWVERSAGSGSGFSGRVWVTDQGVIARLDGEGDSRGRRGRTVMNFGDVRIGPVDPGLFELPSGLRVVKLRGADAAAMLESLEAMSRLGRRAP
jgi:hypothetical protein